MNRRKAWKSNRYATRAEPYAKADVRTDPEKNRRVRGVFVTANQHQVIRFTGVGVAAVTHPVLIPVT